MTVTLARSERLGGNVSGCDCAYHTPKQDAFACVMDPICNLDTGEGGAHVRSYIDLPSDSLLSCTWGILLACSFVVLELRRVS